MKSARTLSLLFLAASLLWPKSAWSQTISTSLLTTITNPTPADSDVFGGAVSAMGNDRVLVGAEGASEAYLFNLQGKVLTTFPIPEPGAGSFGAALAAVGSDRVIIGAYNYAAGTPLAQVGRAYLYTTNGTLLTTFMNPAPATVQAFGFAVAAVGSSHVLIGTGGGGPFLFGTNGVLVTTFTHPGPGTFSNFGTSIAAVGTDKVLIGGILDNKGASGAGAAYLFGTNGTLLTTFTNPAPIADDNFGTSVAAVGTERVLIGAVDYAGLKGTGGTAYLFSTNGTLLTAFTNPTPASSDLFGCSVAAVGTSRVLIGAYQDSSGDFQDGSAYLFSTNGMLLATFTNPTPGRQDWFAYSVAAIGTDRVIIGGVWDNTGAPRAGSAYVYDLPYPPLNIAASGASVSLNWVTPETGLVLQQTDQLNPADWSTSSDSVSVIGLTNQVQQTLVTARRFFRLQRP